MSKDDRGTSASPSRRSGAPTGTTLPRALEKKREILDSAKGQMFYVTFVKADGTLRTMQAKKWIEKALASGDKNVRGVSTVPPENYSLVDLEAYKADPKRSYRSLKLESLKSATVAGITYTFND